MKFEFQPAPQPMGVTAGDWSNWQWQVRHSLKSIEDFRNRFVLSLDEERGFAIAGTDVGFQIRTTPYYASLASTTDPRDPIRRIFMPNMNESATPSQALFDPLGERKNNPASRIIHRYPDRVLFLVTDFCSVYCRYCTRKHFTGGERAFAKADEYAEALQYIASHPGIREVILSGGDPLTLSDDRLEQVLRDLREIDHVEIIRIGTRMPVVNPMRITLPLAQILRAANPVYVMTHFNHPRELTREAADALTLLVDHGIPVMNQMVLLNGVNNSAAIVQALSRRLLFLRVKPYYMFQCDPSLGTDHLRTSVEESEAIQRELWGNLSGLAMPTLSLDIPGGGGKVSLTPEFENRSLRMGSRETGVVRVYEGWDGVRAEYVSPPQAQCLRPIDAEQYEQEWRVLKMAKSAAGTNLTTAEYFQESPNTIEAP